MEGRHGSGYEVRARIEHRSGGRGRLAVIGAAGVALAWAAVSFGSPHPPRTATSASTSPTVLLPGPLVVATYPPAIEVRDGAPVGPIPVVVNAGAFSVTPDAPTNASLAWLDPRAASLGQFTDATWLPWRFLRADGAVVCACLEQDGRGTLTGTLHLVQFDASGGVSSRRDLAGAFAPAAEGDSRLDIELTPDSRAFLVALATLEGGTWVVRAQRLSLAADGALDSDWLELGRVAAPPIDQRPHGVRVAFEPKGTFASVVLDGDNGGPAPSAAELGGWIVPLAESGLGRPHAWSDPWPGEFQGQCLAEAWDAAPAFVRICLVFDPAYGTPRTVVRIVDPEATARQWDLDPGPVYDQPAWIIDGTAKVAYGWWPTEQRVTRFDLLSGVAAERVMPPSAAFRPESAGSPESPRGGWQPTSSSMDPSRILLVGSPDGGRLYVAGSGISQDGFNFASTGIWVIDTAALRILGHWAPAAEYTAIGLTPDGRFLMGVGGAMAAEQQQFGNHGATLVFHATGDGSTPLIIRNLQLTIGGDPTFLVAGSAP